MNQTLVIVGGQWGDEGKGKVIDFLTEKTDLTVRYAGGNNAGHTVKVAETTYKFHLIPSGIIHDNKLNIIANGTAIDPAVLVGEIEQLEQSGFSVDDSKLVISSSAHIIQDKHKEEDTSALSKKIGTTGRGIGPCYKDKIARSGMRMHEFIQGDSKEAQKLKPLIKDTPFIINEAIDKGKKVLFEGAQATLLDIDHGTYPFVTSSNCTVGGALTGSGVGPTKINAVTAVFKAYITRVGGGPFVTELGSEKELESEPSVKKLEQEEGFSEVLAETITKANEGEEYSQGRLLRMQGYEYGTTTGRARRCGWFDAVAAQYAVMINGLSSLCITKLDVLQHLKTIKICTGYEIDGVKTASFALHHDDYVKAKPVYEELAGWDEDITMVKSYDDLPENAKKYLSRIEEICGVRIAIVSVGPARDQTIVREDIF